MIRVCHRYGLAHVAQKCAAVLRKRHAQKQKAKACCEKKDSRNRL
jgi:hypothetical protein